MEDQAAVGDDIGEGMQCTDHPYRNNPGGICAFCLQEKLGKLVSSSNGSSHFLSVSSSSSSPSFCSDYGTMGPATRTAPGGSGGRHRVPFLSAVTTTQKKKNNGGGGVRKVTASSSSSTTTLSSNNVVMLKRSKSVAPRPMGAISDAAITDSPRKKSFWSFFYLSSSSSSASDNGSRDLKQHQQQKKEAAESSKVQTARKEDQEAAVAESPGGSQAASSSSFGRKVARSRSVGCGSRSFSGDFLDRISTGFGDCTLRRVESHRESNNNKKMVPHHHHHHDSEEQRIKERVKCGGIFGGFGMLSSSSSTYWLSAAAAAAARDEDFGMKSNRIESKTASARIIRGGGGGRSRSWSWAFASPMRAFRPATSSKSNVITSINAADVTNGGGNGKMINGGSGSNGKVGANPPLLHVGG